MFGDAAKLKKDFRGLGFWELKNHNFAVNRINLIFGDLLLLLEEQFKDQGNTSQKYRGLKSAMKNFWALKH